MQIAHAGKKNEKIFIFIIQVKKFRGQLFTASSAIDKPAKSLLTPGLWLLIQNNFDA